MFSREHMTIQTGVLNVKASTMFKCMFLSEQIKDLCSMLLQWLVVVNRGRSAFHISIAVGNDSLHIA